MLSSGALYPRIPAVQLEHINILSWCVLVRPIPGFLRYTLLLFCLDVSRCALSQDSSASSRQWVLKGRPVYTGSSSHWNRYWFSPV